MDAPTITTIENFQTHQSYHVRFLNNWYIVTVTANTSIISGWIQNVVYLNRYSPNRLVVGVGVQWSPYMYQTVSPIPPLASYFNTGLPPRCYFNSRPLRVGYVNTDPAADTLQLCVRKSCIIIQLRYCDQIPNNLRTFLMDPSNKFVGVWNDQDAEKLAQSIHRLEIIELLDLRNYIYDSEGRSLRFFTFEQIVEVCLGYRGLGLNWEIRTIDWTVPNLNNDQILQASLKAYLCHKLGVRAQNN